MAEDGRAAPQGDATDSNVRSFDVTRSGDLDLYGLADQVDSAEQALAATRDPVDRLLLLTSLAWYLRQRDTRRALEMVAEAMALLPHAGGGQERELRRLTARLLLTKAEGKTLFAELEQAEALLAGARDTFRRIGDPLGEGDARMVEALLALDQGQTRRRLECHREALALYQRTGDVIRQHLAAAWMARDQTFTDAGAVARQWEDLRATASGITHPGLHAVMAYVEGGLYFSKGDFTGALVHYQRGCDQAVLAGQIRLAVLLVGNLGAAHANLNDYVSEFLWRERAHAMARGTGWPAAVGLCLRGMGNTLRRLHQPDRARHLLLEAMEWLRPFGRSRNHAIACEHMGHLDLDTGNAASALRWFDELADIATDLEQGDLLTEAQCGRGRALLELGRGEEAASALAAAADLVASRGDRWREIEVLRSLALLHGHFPDLPGPTLSPGETAPLHFLHRALALGRSIDGYTISGDLLTDLASAHEAVGDLRAALDYERQAGKARSLIHSREVNDRLLSMQAQFETERLRAEGAYHRQLAAFETDRATALQEATDTLELLGRIGQEITASLDTETVFEALHRHTGSLMPADAFSIYLLDASGENLELCHGLEGARALPTIWRHLSDPISLVARCARERQELLVLRGAHETSAPSHIPGTLFMRTLLLAPLLAGSNLLGVMTVQTQQDNAYGEREKLIFRTLSAYGAIALANAAAYTRLDNALSELRATRDQLLQQENHASLGQLVAGITHEINTPLGIALTLSTHLQNERDEIADSFTENRLKRTALEQFLEKLEDGLRILTGNLERAAGLVRSFRQVSADRSSEAARRLDLVEYLADILKSLTPMLRQRGVATQIMGPPGIMVTTLPGALAQIVSNLVQNAVIHGLAGVPQPAITIEAQPEHEGYITLVLADNGTGMAADVRERAFDPFFTTRRDAGGTGMGLHIVHDLVTGPLGGTIMLESEPGKGTRFLIRLPVQPPPAR
ncbi:ATP-binding protein [Niveispirillum irakense]|uniref:sensor histidine kinase n=1 Tax=Niveispirillum irakense TaxID=34011 RepID=UPI000416AA52|nr:ATP-binding protein [Niveispirillum irakense]